MMNMKKIIFFVIGFILITMGCATNMSGRQSSVPHSIDFQKIKNISIFTQFCDIELIADNTPSENNNISLEYTVSNIKEKYVSVTIEDDTLIFKEESFLTFLPRARWNPPLISIRIPKNHILQTLTIETENTSMIKNLTAAICFFRVKNGKFQIEDSTITEKVKIQMESGSFAVHNSHFENIDFKTDTGNIYFQGEMYGNNIIQSKSGNVSMNLNAEASLYALYFFQNINNTQEIKQNRSQVKHNLVIKGNADKIDLSFAKKNQSINLHNGKSVICNNIECKNFGIHGEYGNITMRNCIFDSPAIITDGNILFDGILKNTCTIASDLGWIKIKTSVSEKLLNPSVTSSVGKVIITGFNSKNASIKSGIDSVSITDSIIE
ncbi:MULTISPECIES: DUF4097 family beta strand repeat-containing protein [unclassified Treponema]|uniref:DUF4097 family beta strand repeat-containing protein n=1 Tax=unclassified Treponema TaxID=2638727 RepID=UPI0020A4F179|nr:MULTISPECIES: DUF4097 family beta strand repeat-containing protein [unclassified Treponema]UTC67370.1 DUF4097 family beta strand repeat protein [Treponema sp. OMZ 789]UTC70098.1 DUF4097 family beta strand repeat protein [Treponema sp. OMZ 790]UTC72813.1 DUF4097 family beta strand repeat protein [Treponema sp. OMZ 791]